MNEIVPAERIAEVVAEAYELPGDVSAELLRRGFNDTYAVVAGDTKFTARVYLAGKYYLHSDDDIRFELDLLTHLGANGVGVSAPLARADGTLLGVITDDAGAARPLAVFTWADGETVEEHVDAEVAESFGANLGAIHAHADAFESPYTRYRLDATYLLDQPEQLIRDWFAQSGDDRIATYDPTFTEMRDFLASQPDESPAFGYVHGDPHGRNAHVDDTKQVTFFDFDHGGFGWRAYDVLTASHSVPDEHRDAFIEGYRSEFPLSDDDERHLQRWTPIRLVWDIGDVMAMAPVRGKPFNATTDQAVEFLDRVATRWREANRDV